MWLRVQTFKLNSPEKLVCAPSRSVCCNCCATTAAWPVRIWAALDVSKQGALDLLRPLIAAGLVEKIGNKKTGRYALRSP